MVERIYISEAMRLCGYISVRQFKIFCEKNGLEILCDDNSTKQYLLKSDLLAFLNKKPLECLENRKRHAGEKVSAVLTHVSHERSASTKVPLSDTEKRILQLLKNL
jgi:hypothetical protein